MTNTIIRRVIVLGALSILSLLSVQTYWVLRSWNLQEQEFDRKVRQALLDTARDLARIGLFVLQDADLINQVYSNYYVVNINNQFDEATLEFYLQKAFENQGMREDFQYGIFDCSSNKMVSGKMIKYKKPSAIGEGEQLDAPLPTHYDSDFIYYFGVRFPNKSANLLSNMWIVVIFTGLILITVAFFIYAMIVILRQKQLSELQRDFINNMTHEFKTPISTINISTDVFLQNELIKADPRLSRYSTIIKEQIMRLNTQVEKVLQLAKIERDRIDLSLEDIDLTELLRSISPSIELKVGEKNGTLQLQLEAAQSMIRADRLHLTNILHNLVDNGVKYSKSEPLIVIQTQNKDGHLVLRVQDNGIGISKEHQRHVFNKFYRVPTGNVHNVKGFGLGLFYVKTICKEHHWKIHLSSEPGKGTSVEIRMPTLS
ncbi:MAG: HAMP domain-containing histidine kinase [Saprospirales bacterium]|jgi:two-component system phosphate regulon sensor histidine kinase PhoR|nr:HAMP domain-containing histidine kinase [Saprospirales bacterium]MBK8921879.1 HAMP domain-containing histidine kinase [Saprospirales bacterium]